MLWEPPGQEDESQTVKEPGCLGFILPGDILKDFQVGDKGSRKTKTS